MGNRIDITGQKFGRLVAVRKGASSGGRNPRTRWDCLCECGATLTVDTFNLIRCRAQSCGCLHKEIVGAAKTTHGLHKTGAYKSWQAMLGRCTQKTNASYPNYGGRGISVCERWSLFENFFADMGQRPEGMTLDRIKSDDGYRPGNCKWSNKEDQDNNKRTNVYVEFQGKKQTLTQWANELGLAVWVLRLRYKRNGNFDPVIRNYKRISK